MLHKIQQLVHEHTMYARPAYGPSVSRVAESGLGLIPGHAFSVPYEDVTLVVK
jgi:hypothetical protein